jgi:hypothetical protein
VYSKYNTSYARAQVSSCPKCGYRISKSRTRQRCFNCDYVERGSDGPWSSDPKFAMKEAESIWEGADAFFQHERYYTDVYEYLKCRRIHDLATTCDQLRIKNRLHHVVNIKNGDVLVARIWHVRKGFVGVHLTRCEWAGGDPQYVHDERRTVGQCRGGAVWFGAVTPTTKLVVGEGIETVLSAMILWNASAGAATLGTEGLKALALPSAARHVVIAADNDVPELPHRVGIGLRAARAAQRLWLAEDPNIDVEIKIAPPPQAGALSRDWNDVLMESGHG